jgi:hypothetical protein
MATAAGGVGILAFTPMSIHDEIQAAEEEANVYDEANTLTPKDSCKKHASKVLCPLTTLEELLSMLR